MVLDIAYRMRLAQLEAMAYEFLHLEFHDGSKSYETFVGSRFIWLDRMHLSGEHIGRDIELLKLRFLFKHLDELRDNHPEAYKRVRKQVRKAKKEDQYYGARMEVNVASSLVRKKLDFISRESPDFELLGNYRKLFIECGSGHVTSGSVDYIKKISLVVIGKCKKPYANNKTVLMLDVTNPIFHGIAGDEADPIEKLRLAIYDVIKNRGFGSVILFSYGVNKEHNKIFTNYIRVDAPGIDGRLLDFLQNHYPKGGDPQKSYYYTSQS